MTTEFSKINTWLRKLDSRIKKVEDDTHYAKFWVQELNKQMKRISELENKCNELDQCIDEAAATISSLKETLKKFIKLPDEQSQADFNNEVDSA